MAKKKLEFNMKFNDYEIRACPKHLIRLSPDEENTTIDFVRLVRGEGKDHCHSIGYFEIDKEGDWVMRLVGDRFKEVPREDIQMVWEMLKAAYDCLTEWSKQEEL